MPSLGRSTILPITPPFPSKSCACLASARGNRCATSGLIFFLLKKVKQCDQILSKPCRFQAFKCLDAVGDHPLAAREKPAAGDVQPENCDGTITMTTTTTPGTKRPSQERPRKAMANDP